MKNQSYLYFSLRRDVSVINLKYQSLRKYSFYIHQRHNENITLFNIQLEQHCQLETSSSLSMNRILDVPLRCEHCFYPGPPHFKFNLSQRLQAARAMCRLQSSGTSDNIMRMKALKLLGNLMNTLLHQTHGRRKNKNKNIRLLLYTWCIVEHVFHDCTGKNCRIYTAGRIYYYRTNRELFTWDWDNFSH